MDELLRKLEKQRIRNGEISSPSVSPYKLSNLSSKDKSKAPKSLSPWRIQLETYKSKFEKESKDENASPNICHTQSGDSETFLPKDFQSPDVVKDSECRQLFDPCMMSCRLCDAEFTSTTLDPTGLQTAKMLSCLHSFCKGCLIDLSGANDYKLIVCPLCSSNTEFIASEVDLMTANCCIENLIDIANLQVSQFESNATIEMTEIHKRLCGYCEESNADRADWACTDCEDEHGIAGLPLCGRCKSSHTKSRAFKYHNIVDLGELEMSTAEKRLQQPRCTHHPSKAIEFFCNQCGEVVCQLCVTAEHAGHRFILVQDLADSKRAELLSRCEEVKTEGKAFAAIRGSLEQLIASYAEKKSKLHETIDSVFYELIQCLENRKREAHDELDAAAANTTKQLEAHDEFLLLALRVMDEYTGVVEGKVTKETNAQICSTFDVTVARLHEIVDKPKQILSACDEVKERELTIWTDPLADVAKIISRLCGVERIEMPISASALAASAEVLSKPDHKAENEVTYVGDSTMPGACDVDLFETDDAVYMCIADNMKHCVHVYDTLCGKYVRSIGLGRGTFTGQLDTPSSVALQTSTGGSEELYVADTGNHRVQCFNALSGAYLRTIGSGRGSGRGQLSRPRYVALNVPAPGAETLLYVSDTSNHRVQVYHARTGTYVRTIGNGPGTGMGQLDEPLGLTVLNACSQTGGKSLLFVADFSNNRIQVFDAITGAFVRSLSAVELDGPYGIDVREPVSGKSSDAVLLYVTERNTARIQALNILTGAVEATICRGNMPENSDSVADIHGSAITGGSEEVKTTDNLELGQNLAQAEESAALFLVSPLMQPWRRADSNSRTGVPQFVGEAAAETAAAPQRRVDHPRGLAVRDIGEGRSLLFVADKGSAGICAIAV